jgi:hypothetical protein
MANCISFLPIPNAPGTSFTGPEPAEGVVGVTATVPSPSVGITLNAGSTIPINVAQDTPQSIIDRINSRAPAGVVASLDRFGRLAFTGSPSIGGDSTLRTFLGL